MLKALWPLEVISRLEFIEKWRDNLSLTYQDAFWFSVIVWSSIEIHANESPDSSMITIESEIVENKSLTLGNIRSKIKEFIRSENQLDTSDSKEIRRKLFNDNTETAINDFLQFIDKLCSKESIEVIDFIEWITLAGIKINIKELLSILCWKSTSMKSIKTKVIKDELTDCLRKEIEEKEQKEKQRQKPVK